MKEWTYYKRVKIFLAVCVKVNVHPICFVKKIIFVELLLSLFWYKLPLNCTTRAVAH